MYRAISKSAKRVRLKSFVTDAATAADATAEYSPIYTRLNENDTPQNENEGCFYCRSTTAKKMYQR